ncbi:hypothetical protein [Streptomyces neyagawaensis]|uniref:hypothetical protein n=1 Tax=Streptomyces neyagawaensis TaxID=42238 RepID=UPI0006E1758A|nr:hypothetical protein [Streptomyces neyagawaensis]MCL6732585.1 hypothetical protein [Streptomyces neyagawaensis]MDE1681645.1 hypothetical protein [Streptomyces neyagawaensis]
MIGNRTKSPARAARRTWSAALRSSWTVACAAAVVVLGPTAVTASALERANSAPPHGASAPAHPARGHEGEPQESRTYTAEQTPVPLPRTRSRGVRA